MSAMAATYSRESSSTPTRSTHRGVSLDEVAYLARRRAVKLDSPLPTAELVQRTLSRFDSTFGRMARPVDLDGWLRRAMREIVVTEKRAQQARPSQASDQSGLARVLEGLAARVRSPALAKQRKLLLRRVSELVGGPERRVVFALITQPSLDRVSDQLGISSAHVARLHRRGLQQLQNRLVRDNQLAQRLQEASRQPRRPRTSHEPESGLDIDFPESFAIGRIDP